jgi:predicted transcriptional regulator
LRNQLKRRMEEQMNKHLDANQRQFGPQQYKCFEGSLCAFFEKECPQIGGERIRLVLVQSIAEMVRRFYPETSHLQPGQTTWVAVHKDAGPAYGKSIANTKLTPVVLDLVLADEAVQRAKGEKLRDIKRDAAARLFNQAYQQDGVLTNTEVALLLKISPGTVGKYIVQWETERNQVLPRRGTIHDMGPSLTHKRIIIHKLFIEHKTVENVAKETNHSFEAIQNYIGTFRQVLLCRKKGMNSDEIAFAIKRTSRLVHEYEKIIEHYAQESNILNKLLDFNPKVK